MRVTLIFLFALTYNIGHAQIVTDIDPAFKNALINDQTVILFGSNGD